MFLGLDKRRKTARNSDKKLFKKNLKTAFASQVQSKLRIQKKL